MKKNLTPISPHADTTVETWLKSCPYPEWRRQELAQKWAEINGVLDPKFHFKVKSFVKDECYCDRKWHPSGRPVFKHARAINSRTDEFKCRVGPIFRLIEQAVYQHPAFIKKVPVNERPTYIRDLLYRTGAVYQCTDYSQYECSFTAEIMEACEFVLYDYMLGMHPEHDSFMHLMRGVIAGVNECTFKHFNVRCPATRMSGEMNTSLGNGFSNLMLTLFLAEQNKCTHVAMVVEGDDGLASFVGTSPTREQYAQLGFNIKLEVVHELNKASFCGLIFDVDDLVNVTDPIEALVSFGWAMRAYTPYGHRKLMALLRCKALSYAHQYPGCPILQSLAKYALRMTRSYDVRFFIENDRNISMWDREQFRSALTAYRGIPDAPVPDKTRLLVEEEFDISVADQLSIESYLDGLDRLAPLRHPAILRHVPLAWSYYYEHYVERICELQELKYPVGRWFDRPGFIREW